MKWPTSFCEFIFCLHLYKCIVLDYPKTKYKIRDGADVSILLLASNTKHRLVFIGSASSNKKNSGAIRTRSSMGYMLTQVLYGERKLSFHISTKTHLLEFSTFSGLSLRV